MMKRTAAFAGMLFLTALGLAAAVWDGSAVAGGAGDFPDDGFYGACNSFPRDTSVTVTNLENGKTVTVTITRNVDNPGVFIALSPKAAAELGMRAGSASRIRAVALIASQAETSLPPTRAGETSDPDYNPKIYVEREKAAVAAAAATPQAVAAAPSIPAAPQPAPALPSSTEPKPVAVAPAAVAVKPAPAAKPAAPESAEVLAKVGEPQKKAAAALPSLSEPKPAIASVAPASVEVLGDAKPNPRKSSPPRLVVTDPALPSAASPAAPAPAAVVKAPEKASVDALARPQRPNTASTLALAEPAAEFAPEGLPDAVLSRIVAPTKVVPEPVLAEAEAPKGAIASKEGIEALALDKPSYAEAVEEAALAEATPPSPEEFYSADRPGKAEGEGAVSELAEAGLPGSPEALYSSSPTKAAGAMSELQAPDVPRPSESIADARKAPGEPPYAALGEPAVPTPTESLSAGRPNAVAPGQAIAELAEPNPQKAVTVEKPAGPETATAVAAEKPAPIAASGPAELQAPAVPSPTESIAAEHPAAVAGGAKTVTLEPASPRPPVSAAPAPGAPAAEPKPAQPAAVATIKGPAPAGAAQAPSSIPMLKGLAKGSFYVQIGVYGTNDALQSAIGGFTSSSYPLAVEKLTTKAGSAAYRLFVGPLSRDESGVVLIRIRSLGFKDAYVRQGT
jgi:rare lipoprotein A (peptidoglycan hydrolase)